MTSRLSILILLILCPLAGAPAVHAQGSPSPPSTEPATDPLLWPEPLRAFYQDGPGLLLSAEERQRFLTSDDTVREAFVRQFLADKKLAAAIERRQRLARAEYLSPRDVRAQLLFLNGPPYERKPIDCGTAFRPIEIWTYRTDGPSDPKTGRPEPKLAREVVYQAAPDEPFRAWSPIDGKQVLYTPRMAAWLEDWEEINGAYSGRFDLRICKQAELVDQATGAPGLSGSAHGRRQKRQVAAILVSGYGIRPWTSGAAREGFFDPPRDLAQWAREAAATPLPQPTPETLNMTPVAVQFPEKAGQRMLARAIVRVTLDEHVKRTEEAGKPRVGFIVEGALEREGRVFDEFRLRYHLPIQKGEVDLSVDRELRPGQTFLLRLKVRDETGGAEAVTAKAFRVPLEPSAPSSPTSAVAGQSEPPRKGEELATTSGGTDTVTLFPPDSDVVVSVFRAEAIVTGHRIAKMTFFVDGQRQLTRNGPPYTAELRLSQFPTEQLVRAEGYDQAGKLVAADEVVVNEPRGLFKVSILEPPKGAKIQEAQALAKAEVSVPEGRRVETVQFKVNDKLVATLTRPPWETPIPLPQGEATVYLAVSATLDDGQTSEETRFLRAPQYVEEVDVDLVELYTAVTDSSNNLARGLTEEDFQVLEGGKPQKLTKFEQVENLPLVVGIAMDTSGSMASSLAEAESAAASFLTKVVKPKDQCFALTFSGRPVLRMPLTDDVEVVAQSLEGLQAVGATAMHDAIVHALYYFRGTHGQKALVLLSDGDDTSSDISFKDALEYAKRSGVAIYTIGLKVSLLSTGIRSKLSSLAEETGGRTYFINKAAELSTVYAEISSELRTRYLLAFNAERKPGDKSYHPIEVKVLKRGLKARTVHGYYP